MKPRWQPAIPASPPLSRGVAIDMMLRAQKGDRAAYDVLVRSMVGFISKLVWKYTRNGQGDPDDLFSAGLLGFDRAVRKFDAGHGCAVTTYAEGWVHAYIRLELNRQSGTIDGPRNWQIRASLPRFGFVSIDSHEDALGEMERTRPDLLSTDPESALLEMDEYRKHQAELENYLQKHCRERERDLLTRRLRGETLEMIGQDFGLSRERVRQLEVAAMRHMERHFQLPMGSITTATTRQVRRSSVKK